MDENFDNKNPNGLPENDGEVTENNRKAEADASNTNPENSGGKKPSYTSFITIMCVLGGILLSCVIYGLASGNLADVMSTVGSVALAILVLLVMITVHELGHFIAGKALGFGINEFAIGFGPAVYQRTGKSGQVFSIRALPLGGYCAFEGEDDDSTSPTAFNNRKPWQRIIVLVAGAFMNFLLALVLIVLMFGTYGQSMLTSFEVVPDVQYSMSLEDGDVIVELDGKSVYMQTDLISALKGKEQGDVVSALVYRTGEDGKQVPTKIKIVLRTDVDPENSTDMSAVSRALGIATLEIITETGLKSPFTPGDALLRECNGDYQISKDNLGEEYLAENRIYGEAELNAYLSKFKAGDEVKMWVLRDGNYVKISFSLPQKFDGTNAYEALAVKASGYQNRWSTTEVKLGFLKTLGGTIVYAFKIAGTIFTVLGELITGALGLNAMGGTITTVVMTSQVIKLGGLQFLLEIAAYIGVNLAVFNLLPLPALDGSRVVFTLIEMIFKKPVPKKIEGVIHTVGLIVLFGFAILVDLLQLF